MVKVAKSSRCFGTHTCCRLMLVIPATCPLLPVLKTVDTLNVSVWLCPFDWKVTTAFSGICMVSGGIHSSGHDVN